MFEQTDDRGWKEEVQQQKHPDMRGAYNGDLAAHLGRSGVDRQLQHKKWNINCT